VQATRRHLRHTHVVRGRHQRQHGTQLGVASWLLQLAHAPATSQSKRIAHRDLTVSDSLFGLGRSDALRPVGQRELCAGVDAVRAGGFGAGCRFDNTDMVYSREKH
jgi:hypothetical protein